MKKTVILSVVAAFALSLAVPAFAAEVTHTSGGCSYFAYEGKSGYHIGYLKSGAPMGTGEDFEFGRSLGSDEHEIMSKQDGRKRTIKHIESASDWHTAGGLLKKRCSR